MNALPLGGPGLAAAYINLPELTAQRFVPATFSMRPGERLYKTGDLVRRLADGNLEFLGRLDHQVKVRGFRIELGEIEAALAAHPLVKEVVVAAREDRRGANWLVAYVVPKPGGVGDSSEMRRFLRQRLPEYMIPSAFVILEALPLTSNGKLDRQALPMPSLERPAGAGDFVSPRNHSEEIVAGICAEVLGLEQIGVNDNVFDLGCHSLLATKIVLRIREAFQVELPLVRLFEKPTVAGLAEALESCGKSGAGLEVPPIRIAPRDQALPLSFAQERLWFLSQLDPTNTSYYVPRALRISGAFSVRVLEQSFSEIIRRHEILRTTFPMVDGRPVQVINAYEPIHIPLIDLRLLSEDEREQYIHHHIIEEGNRNFDLARGPLLRLKVLQLSDREFILILTEHHLVHDGWTQGVLMRGMLVIAALALGRILVPAGGIGRSHVTDGRGHHGQPMVDHQLALLRNAGIREGSAALGRHGVYRHRRFKYHVGRLAHERPAQISDHDQSRGRGHSRR